MPTMNSLEVAKEIARKHDCTNLRHTGVVETIAEALDAAEARGRNTVLTPGIDEYLPDCGQ